MNIRYKIRDAEGERSVAEDGFPIIIGAGPTADIRISDLKAELGFSVLFISHDMPLLMDIASHIGVLKDGRLVEVAQENFTVSQTRQIVHIDDLCNECGNCATFCPTSGRPYRDKPRLHVDREGDESVDTLLAALAASAPILPSAGIKKS